VPGTTVTVSDGFTSVPGGLTSLTCNFLGVCGGDDPNAGANANAFGMTLGVGLGGGRGPANNRFRKLRLPKNAKTCSAMGLQFYAPPGFDLSQIVAAGQSGGLFGAWAAVGFNGTFDFQRETSILTGTTTFYSGYTNASNIAVGAYMYGAGYSNWQTNVIAGGFAQTMSSNAGAPEQSLYWNIGYDLAANGVTPSCTP
jgi:hypothetical protein